MFYILRSTGREEFEGFKHKDYPSKEMETPMPRVNHYKSSSCVQAEVKAEQRLRVPDLEHGGSNVTPACVTLASAVASSGPFPRLQTAVLKMNL